MAWFYITEGSAVGPVSREELAALREQGALADESQVAQEGDPDWSTYADAFKQESENEEPVKPVLCIASATGEEVVTTVQETAYSFSSLTTLLICCLFFGYVFTEFLPSRYLVGSFASQISSVALLGIPALTLATYGIFRFLKPEHFPVRKSVLAMLFTMVVGIAALLALQAFAAKSLNPSSHVGKGKMILMLIGWAYEAAQSANIFKRIVGSVFGIGLCEEFTKLLPLFYLVLRSKAGHALPTYRGFLVVGFFSGLGFGIGEALLGYSPWTGNLSMDGNVLRWFACIPLHAIYTVIDAAFLWFLAPRILKAPTTQVQIGTCICATLVVAVVHGLYDVLTMIPHAGFFIDLASVILMVYVVRYFDTSSQETLPLSSCPTSGNFSNWLHVAVTSKRLKTAYIATAVLILASFGLSMSEEKLRASDWADGQTSNVDNSEPSSDFSDSTASNNTYADREAIHEFDSAWGIARSVSGSSDLTTLLGALDTVNWKNCSSDLKEAANRLGAVKSGDSQAEANNRIRRFSDLCELRR